MIKWPGHNQRTAVLGRTGSGKTHFAAWLLSGYDFRKQPWLLMNTKGDALLNEIADIEDVKELDLNETPDDTGLYIVNPNPEDTNEIDSMLRRVWDKQNCGVLIDEVYMIDEDAGMNALLTQGRSRNCPMIVLSQRPAWCSKFVFSEADFVSVFHLQNLKDRQNVKNFVPLDVDARLPKHHSFWYNVGDNEISRLGPVPDKDAILKTFRAKLSANNARPASQEPVNDLGLVTPFPRKKRVV